MKVVAALVLAAIMAGCATQTAPLRRDPPPPRAASLPAEIFDPTLPVPARAREVVFHALSLVGTPYQAAGRFPDTGFDCSGLVQYVLGQAAGVSMPRDTSNMRQVGAEIGTGELRPGDLVFFNTLGRPYSHVGIYVGGQRFIHAPTQGGFVGVVDMRLPYWQQRFDGARRLDL